MSAETSDRPQRKLSHEIVMECDARSDGTFRSDAVVRLLGQGGGTWEIAADEGTYPHGGDASAPPPLTYFVAGLVTCLMTQIRAFSKKMRIPVDGVRAHARLHWTAAAEARAPYEARCEDISIDLDIDSTAPRADVLRLIAAARKGCFVEATLSRANDIRHRLKTEDGWIDA